VHAAEKAAHGQKAALHDLGAAHAALEASSAQLKHQHDALLSQIATAKTAHAEALARVEKDRDTQLRAAHDAHAQALTRVEKERDALRAELRTAHDSQAQALKERDALRAELTAAANGSHAETAALAQQLSSVRAELAASQTAQAKASEARAKESTELGASVAKSKAELAAPQDDAPGGVHEGRGAAEAQQRGGPHAARGADDGARPGRPTWRRRRRNCAGPMQSSLRSAGSTLLESSQKAAGSQEAEQQRSSLPCSRSAEGQPGRRPQRRPRPTRSSRLLATGCRRRLRPSRGADEEAKAARNGRGATVVPINSNWGSPRPKRSMCRLVAYTTLWVVLIFAIIVAVRSNSGVHDAVRRGRAGHLSV